MPFRRRSRVYPANPRVRRGFGLCAKARATRAPNATHRYDQPRDRPLVNTPRPRINTTRDRRTWWSVCGDDHCPFLFFPLPSLLILRFCFFICSSSNGRERHRRDHLGELCRSSGNRGRGRARVCSARNCRGVTSATRRCALYAVARGRTNAFKRV